MLVGDRVTYDAVNEAYCLLTAYIREEGKIGAKYNTEELSKFVKFLSEILKHPENFVEPKQVEDKVKIVPDHEIGRAHV